MNSNDSFRLLTDEDVGIVLGVLFVLALVLT